MKMENVMTIRLPKEDLDTIEQISKQEKIDKSTAVRELVEKGRVYLAITGYADGKLSIGKAAEIAGIAISEMMDLLANLGIKSKLDIDDYMQGKKVAAELFRPK